MKIIISDLFIFVLLFLSLREINLSFLHLFGLRIWFLKPTREDIKGNKLVSGLGVWCWVCWGKKSWNVFCEETMSKLDLYICFVYGRNEFSSSRQIGEMSKLGDFKGWRRNMNILLSKEKTPWFSDLYVFHWTFVFMTCIYWYIAIIINKLCMFILSSGGGQGLTCNLLCSPGLELMVNLPLQSLKYCDYRWEPSCLAYMYTLQMLWLFL